MQSPSWRRSREDNREARANVSSRCIGIPFHWPGRATTRIVTSVLDQRPKRRRLRAYERAFRANRRNAQLTRRVVCEVCTAIEVYSSTEDREGRARARAYAIVIASDEFNVRAL